MKSLDVLLRGGPSTITIRTDLELPDGAPDVPLELDNPLGRNTRWRRVSPEHQRPAIYEQVGAPHHRRP